MQVFIVMVETAREGGWWWDVERVFSTMDSAKSYVAGRRLQFRSGRFPQDCPEYMIVIEEVYA